MRRSLFAAGVLGAMFLGGETECAAFNESTHRRIVEVSAHVLNATEGQALPVPPGVGGTTIPANVWADFIRRLSVTNRRLATMRTGLTGAYKGAGERDVMDPEAVPSPISPPDSVAASTRNNPATCGYNKTDGLGLEFNLLNAAQTKIEDFPYRPADDYRPCAYAVPAADTALNDRARHIGAVLGWHAASVDRRTKDSALWLKPSSSIFANGPMYETFSRGFEYYLGALLVPIVCLKELIVGAKESCDDESFDLARKLNPVEYMSGIVPGIPLPGSDDFVGMWHFIDVSASVNRYNEPRGLFWENAGPSYPGIIDVAIMVGADLAGITLNPFEADGIKRYGRFDHVKREGFRWNSHTIAHTEFSPVSNLARHGWDTFGGANAAPLAFPLHAIGDAAAPHHVVGTSSWGHRPFEDGVAFLEDTLLPTPTNATAFAAMRDRVLAIALQALQGLDVDPSIEDSIRVEAKLTRALAESDGDFVFKDLDSERYFAIGSKSAAIDSYRKASLTHLRPFVELAIGHTIAFLVTAGERIGDANPPTNPISRCPAGQHFTGVAPGCAPTPVPGPTVSLPPNVAETSSACAPLGYVCGQQSDCCDSSALCTSNRCSNSTPPVVCSDTSAPCTGNVDCGGYLCVSGCCDYAVH